MLDKKARVQGVKDLGSRNYLLTLNSPEQARLTRPGQFVMVKCSEDVCQDPLLRRPLSVFNIHRNSRTGRPLHLELLIKDVGVGTHKLVRLKRGDEVYTLGPQGHPFETDSDMSKTVRVACLVAGGVGIAALFLLARKLISLDVTPVLFYGGRTVRDLILKEYFENLGIEAFYTTEDGSHGERGMVTLPLEAFLREKGHLGLRIYACGPWAMMRAAHLLAVRNKIGCEVSLEARMGCSVGACLGCVIRALDDDGEEQYLRVCQEGPIMSSRIVDWDTPPL
jgi:dihydroorotate dehydrogenase electron transfer subunit